jgi:P-type Ca2+ transporter type 2C
MCRMDAIGRCADDLVMRHGPSLLALDQDAPVEPCSSVGGHIDVAAMADAHALTSDQVFTALGTAPQGLTATEATSRLGRFGRNELPHGRPAGALVIFLRQFLNPLVYVLLVAAMISAVMQDLTDAGFIVAVLLVNAVIGAIQEYGAERSAEALRALVTSRALVVRDGEEREIATDEVVPGDVVLLEAGSKAPADLRLISSGGMEVDESLLTGESMAVTKSSSTVLEPDTALGDRVNMVFAGTLVTRGRAHGLVVATAGLTQIGRIATSISSADTAKPPLLVRMDRFTKRIAAAVGFAALLLGTVLIARGAAPGEVLILAVALAVSAIPEGLPVALTVALAIGARRMGRRNVISRRLVAVEALGSCTFIASDKTGTLTMNELSLRKVVLPGRDPYDVTGPGTNPEGAVVAPDRDRPGVERLAVAAALCNDGFMGWRDQAWVHHGDAVDVALLAFAGKAGVSQARCEATYPRLQEIPFDPERKFAATLHQGIGTQFIVVKGAGERIIAMCSRQAMPDGDAPLATKKAAEQADLLAGQGYRVLAIAAAHVDATDAVEFAPHHLTGLVLLGFVGMIDPLRPEAREAVLACQRAGIQVAMVTGDHPITALAIARELGFAERPDEVVTGPDLALVTQQGDAAVDQLVRDAHVFARVEPNQKLQVVQSLIRLGHFVAVTGDGANDAPALRAAHIGVAMGKRGTDVARESSELILADDNFASIVSGVLEGRVAYANVRKVIFLLISTGAAEVVLFVLTTAAGLPPPLWPAQLLWLNLVTNGIQDVALAFEPAEGGEFDRPPRPPREPIFNRIMVERSLVTAGLMAGIGYLAYDWMLANGWSLLQAQNSLLLLFVLFENIQAGNSRSETVSLFKLNPLRNKLLLVGTVVAQLVHIGAMYTPGLSDVLRIEPVSLAQWGVTLGLALLLFVVAELHKVVIRANMKSYA